MLSILSLAPALQLPRVPQSPTEMIERAASAVKRGVEAGVLRQTVKIVVPDDERTFKVFGVVGSSRAHNANCA